VQLLAKPTTFGVDDVVTIRRNVVRDRLALDIAAFIASHSVHTACQVAADRRHDDEFPWQRVI